MTEPLFREAKRVQTLTLARTDIIKDWSYVYMKLMTSIADAQDIDTFMMRIESLVAAAHSKIVESDEFSREISEWESELENVLTLLRQNPQNPANRYKLINHLAKKIAIFTKYATKAGFMPISPHGIAIRLGYKPHPSVKIIRTGKAGKEEVNNEDE